MVGYGGGGRRDEVRVGGCEKHGEEIWEGLWIDMGGGG